MLLADSKETTQRTGVERHEFVRTSGRPAGEVSATQASPLRGDVQHRKQSERHEASFVQGGPAHARPASSEHQPCAVRAHIREQVPSGRSLTEELAGHPRSHSTLTDGLPHTPRVGGWSLEGAHVPVDHTRFSGAPEAKWLVQGPASRRRGQDSSLAEGGGFRAPAPLSTPQGSRAYLTSFWVSLQLCSLPKQTGSGGSLRVGV